MLKKLLSVLLVLSMAISLFACGKTTTATGTATSVAKETKEVKEDDTTKNSSKVTSNGYSIGNNIYILGVLDNIAGGGVGITMRFSDGLAKVQNNKNYKWGYIDKNGNVVIDYVYDWANDFSDGLARVVNANGKSGFIDKNGKLVIDYMSDSVQNFSEGLAVANNNNYKYGYIDKSGKIVIDYVYDWAYNFSEGLAAVQNANSKWGYIDKSGNLVIDYVYDWAYDFSDGLAAVSNVNGKWGYIDKNGKLVIDYMYDHVGNFSEGLAPVWDEDTFKWGYIDKNGNLVIDYMYMWDNDFSTWNCPFSDGLARVQNDNRKWGYIDKNGNVVIDYVYDYDEGDYVNFSEGLAAVSNANFNYKYGYIDKNGNFAIKPVFNTLSKFSEGIALGQYNDKAILLTYLNPYDLGYTSNQLLNAKNILLANDTDGFFTEYYNSLEKTEPNWIINTSNWNDNDYKKDLEKTIKEKEVKPDTWYVTEAGIWYYFDDDRTTKKTGWYKDPEDNQTYYLNPKTGIMATGWTEIDGDMYYFNDQHGNDPNWFYNAEKDIWASAGKDVKSYGSMFRDEETPDGKRVDAEGRLIE